MANKRNQSEENLIIMKQKLLDSERTHHQQNLLIGELNAKLQQKEEELKAQIEHTATLKQTLKMLKESVKKIENDATALKIEIDKHTQELTDAKESIEQEKAVCERMRSNISRLENNFMLLKGNEQLQQRKLEQYADQAENIEELKKRLEELEEELLSKNAMAEQLKCALKTLQQRSEMIDAEDSKLQEELRAVRAEYLVKEDLLEKQRSLVFQLRLENLTTQDDYAELAEDAKKAEEQKDNQQGNLEKKKSEPSTWKTFAKSCAKNTLIFLALQVASVLGIKYVMHVNHLEIAITTTSPPVF